MQPVPATEAAPAPDRYEFRYDPDLPVIWLVRYRAGKVDGVAVHPGTVVVGSLPLSNYPFVTQPAMLADFRRVATTLIQTLPRED